MHNNHYNPYMYASFGCNYTPKFNTSNFPANRDKIKKVIHVTNNRAKYYSDLALKYKNETKELRDSAKYYAEQNADVSMSYINTLEATLRRDIALKQDSGDYALTSEIPQKVSDLTNDSQFVTSTELSTAVSNCQIQVESSITTLSQNTTSSLNNKANKDLDNITNSAERLIAGMSMPSSTYINLTLGASGSTYTAPANGWFMGSATGNGVWVQLKNATSDFSVTNHTPTNGVPLDIILPVSKGDIVAFGYSAQAGLRFYYAVGSESEAN